MCESFFNTSYDEEKREIQSINNGSEREKNHLSNLETYKKGNPPFLLYCGVVSNVKDVWDSVTSFLKGV